MVIYYHQLTPTSFTTGLIPGNKTAQPMKELTVWAVDFDTNMWECMSITIPGAR